MLAKVFSAGLLGIDAYPIEIEVDVSPGLPVVVVVGLPDDYWGEIAVAVISAKEGHTVDSKQVLDYCSGRIARYSCPREVIIVDQLPRNAMGKVVKEEVRGLALQQQIKRQMGGA